MHKAQAGKSGNSTGMEREPSLALAQQPGPAWPLTYAGGQRFVPHSPVSAQTGQGAAAVHGVPWVAAVLDDGVREVAFVADPVAIAGDARVLAFY